MNVLFLLLFAVNFSASILFGLNLVLQKQINGIELKRQYLLMKIVLLFYIVPAIIIGIFVLFGKINMRLISLSTEDFDLAIAYQSELGIINFERFLLLDRLSVVWLFSAVGLICFRYGINIWRLNHLMLNSVLVRDTNVTKLMSKCCQETEIHQDIPVYMSELVNSPILLGIVKPRILLNFGNYSEEELKLILKHELIHYKKHDILFRLLADGAQCLNWFNPVIYFFEMSFDDYGELACDEIVLTGADMDERTTYSHLILNLAKTKHTKIFFASMFCDTEKIMKRRLRYIMKRTTNNKRGWLTGLLISLYLVCFPIVTYAASMGTLTFHKRLVTEPLNETQLSKAEIKDFKIERIENFDIDNAKIIDGEITRGANTISEDIKKGETFAFKTINLSVGDTVTFTLAADNKVFCRRTC